MTHHATCRPARPTRRVSARTRVPPCVRAGEQSCKLSFQNGSKKLKLHIQCSQQFSIIALTDGSGSITERYAYSAYGKPVFCNASGTDIGDSAEDNRILYTGREWDEELELYHFRKRLYDPIVALFLQRDPESYTDGFTLFGNFMGLSNIDPYGTECHMERHHWFPRNATSIANIAQKCPWLDVDSFTTQFLKCSDPDKGCDSHGWLHGHRNPDHERRVPDWNSEAATILEGSTSCCDYLLNMAAAISAAHVQISAKFDTPECQFYGIDYGTCRLEHYLKDKGSEGVTHRNTTRIFEKIIEACRRDADPEPYYPPSGGRRSGPGMEQIWTIEESIVSSALLTFRILPVLRVLRPGVRSFPKFPIARPNIPKPGPVYPVNPIRPIPNKAPIDVPATAA